MSCRYCRMPSVVDRVQRLLSNAMTVDVKDLFMRTLKMRTVKMRTVEMRTVNWRISEV